MMKLRYLPVCGLLLSVAWGVPPAKAAEAAKIDVDKYQDVDLVTLRATPEKFNNKRIRIITYYKGFLISFPEYMERTGFKADKHYLIRIVPNNLPVMTKKTDAMNELIPGLAKGKVITVYGKLKDFGYSPKFLAPEYYLDLEHIEVMEKPVAVDIPPEMLKEETETGLVVPGVEPPDNRPHRLPRWRR